MKLGITQYAACPDGLHYVENAAKFGLDGVEPFIPSADAEFYAWSDEDVKQFLSHAGCSGIEVPSVAVGVFISDPSLVENSGHEKAVRLTTDSLRFTNAVGAKTMLLCAFIESHPDTPEKKSNLLKVAKTVEPIARQLGVKIGLETPLPAEEVAEIVDSIGSEHVGVYYDVGNAVYLGFDPATEIEFLGNRILSVHLKDTKESLGDAHLGQGRADLARSLDALKRMGYDGWLILETPAGDEAATRDDIRLVKEHLR